MVKVIFILKFISLQMFVKFRKNQIRILGFQWRGEKENRRHCEQFGISEDMPSNECWIIMWFIPKFEEKQWIRI